ncbi:MAG TPA: tRNA pseudouridine synthase A, partial [Chroococcales cyanobacterium]
MPRIALAIEYNGKDFHGSQYQVGVRTVQLEIESALATFFRKPVRLHLSGRTDAGVHAAGQVAHFDVHPGGSDEESRSDKSDREEAEEIDLFRLCASLNGIMGRDISVRAAQFVSGQFHARYKAVARQYVYRIL